MLTVSQLSKSFAGRALFDDVSLQVNRGDAKRFVVRGDEKLTAFLELETVTQEAAYPGRIY